MTGTIKKRVMSLLLALVVLVSAESALWSINIKAYADNHVLKNVQITSEQIEKAIKWATDLAKVSATAWKSKSYNWDEKKSKHECVTFVNDAFYDGANLPRESVQGAGFFLNPVRGFNVVRKEKEAIPPRGAIALYSGGYDGWGHAAISLGGGKVVEAGYDNIRISNLLGNEHSGLTYEGYIWYGDSLPPTSKPEKAPIISAPKTQDEVKGRLDKIIKGEYGDGKTFPYSNTPVPVKLAGTAGDTGTLGYARYAFFQIFGKPLSTGVKSNVYELTNSNGNLKVIASCSGTSTAAQMKADILKTRPGDIIQGKGNGFYQTMIVVSYDENSITILDCDNDYKCGIAVRTRDWARFSGSFKQYTIYRAANYPEPKPTTPNTPGTSSKPSVPNTPQVNEKQKYDINGDGNINVLDVVVLFSAAVSGNNTNLQKYDLNGDGSVNVLDVTVLMTYVMS